MKTLTKDQKKAVTALVVRYEAYQEKLQHFITLEDVFILEGKKYKLANSLNAWASMLNKAQRETGVELVTPQLLDTWMRSTARYINKTEQLAEEQNEIDAERTGN